MELHIYNFRSIKKQLPIALCPITVLYGPNGAGKSSLLYSVMTLKNALTNPNQPVSGFFNYGFTNLGSFQAVVFDHNAENLLVLGLKTHLAGFQVMYVFTMREDLGGMELKILGGLDQSANAAVTMSFPYSGSQLTKVQVSFNERQYALEWNGLTAKFFGPDSALLDGSNDLARAANHPMEILRNAGVVPLKRGFTRPTYANTVFPDIAAGEEALAATFFNNKYLVSEVSYHLERILQRDLRINPIPGSSAFTLDTQDRRTGMSSELVNDGFGVSQVVDLLARCLYRPHRLVCIEEPEIHLHPTAVRMLARTLAEIVLEQDRQKTLLISTHSEAFVLALLSLMSEGKLSPDNVAFYLAKKARKATEFERQQVNDKGQLEGGLASFMEGELADLKAFLKA